jgi:beta-lactam-binding protein with PASTA domain
VSARIRLLIVSALAMSLAAGCSSLGAQASGGSSRRAPALPQVAGLTVEQATQSIEASGFAISNVSPDFGHPDLERVSEAYFPESSLEGNSDPLVLLVGDTTLRPVPSVVGLRLVEAARILRGAGFAVGSTGSRADTAGIVVSQRPLAGIGLAAGKSVELTVTAK